MIDEFERLLAEGGGADQLARVRERLRQSAEEDRQKRLSQIEADFKTCQLIQYGLAQRRDSIPYGIAQGYVRWLRKVYPSDNELARDLLRDLRKQEYEKKQKGVKPHDNRTTESVPGGNGNTGTTSGKNPQGVSKDIQSQESRSGEKVESELLAEKGVKE